MGPRYTYLGDRLTRSELRGRSCVAVLDARGKCIRSTRSTMLVDFEEERHVVLARQLRRSHSVPASI